MYLTAQHVVSPDKAREGVNTFLYFHGALTWEGALPPGVPDQNPGTLTAQSISVPPPGNSVRSYLDIVTPDATRWEEVRAALMEFVGQSPAAPLPWHGSSGRCAFRIGMDIGLYGHWQRELAVLYRAAQALRLANPKSK